jgi:hypothetical protein
MALEGMVSNLAQNAGTTLDSPEGKHTAENSLLAVDGTPVRGNALAGGSGLEGSVGDTQLTGDPTQMNGLAGGVGHGGVGAGASNLDIDGPPTVMDGLAKG